MPSINSLQCLSKWSVYSESVLHRYTCSRPYSNTRHQQCVIRLTNNIGVSILRRLFRSDFTDDRIGTGISIDNRSPCSPSLPSQSHVSRASSSSYPARECQETPLLAARNSSLVRPRIITRVNGSFFSMLRLVHREYVASQRQFHMPLLFPLLATREVSIAIDLEETC